MQQGLPVGGYNALHIVSRLCKFQCPLPLSPLHCTHHFSMLTFSNCSAVHFTVRFKKTDHSSRWSVSLESFVENEHPSVVVDRTHRLAFRTILNVFRWNVLSQLLWSAMVRSRKPSFAVIQQRRSDRCVEQLQTTLQAMSSVGRFLFVFASHPSSFDFSFVKFDIL